jgi:spermidine synthase
MRFSIGRISLTEIDAIVFLCGLSVMVVEIVGARMFTPFFGSTFYVWTSIIGVIMVALSLGYYQGGIEGDKDGSIEGLANILLSGGFYTVLMPFTVMLGGSFFGMNAVWGPIGAAVVALALPSYHLAKVSPYCIRLSTRSVGDVGRVSGGVYSLSTIGSIAGTFLSGFVLIPLFRVSTIVLFLGLFIIAASLFMSVKKKALKVIDSFFILLLFLMQIVWLPSAALAFIPANTTVVYEGESVYNSIMVGDLPTNGTSRMRFLKLGNLIQGGMDLSSNQSFYSYVPLIQLPWLIKPDARDVLFLGNGAGVGIDYLHRLYPDARIDVVDIDSKVFEVATANFWEKEGPNVRFFSDDARLYLQRTDKSYDVIIMDVYGSTKEVPNHLVTFEMTKLVGEHLNDGGVFVQDLVSAVDGPNSRLLQSVIMTTSRTFPATYVLPIDNVTSRRQTVIVVSLQSKIDPAVDVAGFLTTVPLAHRQRLNESSMFLIGGGQRMDLSQGLFLSDEYAPTEGMVLY